MDNAEPAERCEEAAMEARPSGGSSVSRGHRRLLVSAAVMLYAAVTAGGIVCITGSGAGCAGWPRCQGQVIPPARVDAIIEYAHRLVAGLTAPVVIAAAIAGWRKATGSWWVDRAPVIAAICVLSAGTLGAVAVTAGIPAWLAAVDRGCALAALGLMVGASVVVHSSRKASAPGSLSRDRRYARVTVAAAAVVFALLVSGVLADSTSLVRCYGWPILGRMPPAGASHAAPEMARQLLAAVAAGLLAAIVVLAWLTQRKRTAVLALANGSAVLFALEMAKGALLSADTSSIVALGLSVVSTSALWTSLVMLAVLTAFSPGAAEPLARR
jgi:heme A synthase